MNQCKTKEEVVKDIVDFRISVDDNTCENLGRDLRHLLDRLVCEKTFAQVEFVDTSDMEKRAHLSDTLKSEAVDLLVTYNLAGFELCTLTDGLAYNLVDCRQIHLLKKRSCQGRGFSIRKEY